MNILYLINYVILTAFLVLAIIEAGVALLALTSFDELGARLKRYIAPIWQINGTFAVFYVVNFEATYPPLIKIVGSAYVAPLLIAALFLILRNAFLAYSDYSHDKVREKTYFRIYGISTIISYSLALAVFASTASGIGINLQTNSINILQVLFNQFDVPLAIALLLIALFVASILFDIKRYKSMYMVGGIIAIGIIVASYTSISYVIANIVGFVYPVIILLLLLALAIFYNFKNNRVAKLIVIIWLALSILIFGIYQYPYAFGGSVNLTTQMVNAATGYYTALISAVGGAFLAIAMAYFVYITYVKKAEGSGASY